MPADAAMFSTPSTVACDTSLAPDTAVSPTMLAWSTVLLATEVQKVSQLNWNALIEKRDNWQTYCMLLLRMFLHNFFRTFCGLTSLNYTQQCLWILCLMEVVRLVATLATPTLKPKFTYIFHCRILDLPVPQILFKNLEKKEKKNTIDNNNLKKTLPHYG